MERKDEIETAAMTYSMVQTECGKGIDMTKELSFIAGAQWADRHPSDANIKRIAEMILAYNQITPECWCQWTDGESLYKYIKENF